MIFVTVGDSMPFDRLVHTVDTWAKSRQRTDVFAQIGTEGREPAFIPWVRRMDPVEFKHRLETADFIVAHAGMGTVLTALIAGKPLLVLPRLGDLRETRNDHQTATARHMAAAGRLTAAYTEAELTDRLDHLDQITSVARIGPFATPPLIAALRTIIASA